MVESFFDKSIIDEMKEEEYPILKKFKDLRVFLKKKDLSTEIHFEIDGQRLNGSELKSLILLDDKEKFLNNETKMLISHISSKITHIQSIYKVIGDLDYVIYNFVESNIPKYYNEVEVSKNSESLKLDFTIDFDESNNIRVDIESDGDFIVGSERIFFICGDIISILDDKIPVKFYREILSGNNKFSIEDFLEIGNSIVGTLMKNHNLEINSDIEKLQNLEVEEKIAPVIMEIDKTNHFISIELKYRVGDDFFSVGDYKYLETSSWVDKKTLIKVIRENDKLMKYVSDIELSEFIFEDLFLNTRIKFNVNSKNPFQVTLPSSTLENVIARLLPKIHNKFEIIYKDGKKLELNNETVKFDLETNLTRRLDLFEFKVKFKIKNEYFDLDFLKNLVLQNKKYVQLSDGSTANIENIREINKWIEFLSKFEFKRSGSFYKTESTVALELDEFLKDIKEKEVFSNEEYKDLIQELRDKKPVETISVPDCVDEILRDYQKEGVYWLHFLEKYNFGGILADEMGLGKTIQTLSILAMNEKSTHIVVCPKSLVYNWENEIKKYFPDLRVLIIDKDSDKRREMIKDSFNYNIIITSYSMLQKDYIYYMELKKEFHYMILDEAHYVKNIKTLSSKAVRVMKARRKILLTGTPLENNLEELFGTFELIMPGYLGSKNEFRRDFVSKIERNNMIALEILQAKIRPFILRRTKSQVLKELPEKQEQIVYNEMTNKQVAIYNEVLNRVKDEVQRVINEVGFDRARIQVLSALLKLRQICNHPSLLDKSFVGEHEISGKYEQFMDLLSEVIAGGEKVLVFSQFTSMLDIFEDELKNQKIEFLRLDGSTKDRQGVVDKFNNDESVKVFLISLKAGGVGLNLTAASAVFLYDPWWNPMAEQQAVDRAHRIGQKRNVNIYKFITKNSIEEKILKLQETKGNLFENLVVEDNGFVKKLEWEDLMELFD